jgi:hypothetical protein
MLTITCKLVFRDGQTATARASAASRIERVRVIYSGASHRLGDLLEATSVLVLRAFCQQCASRQRAHLVISSSGNFDIAE